MTEAPRSVRNNNPGNLRPLAHGEVWQGQAIPQPDPGYVTFVDAAHGFRAMCKLLRNYQRLHNLHTLLDILQRYAPPGDNNDPAAYAATVSKFSGIPKFQQINLADPETCFLVMRAMARVEAGVDAWRDEDIRAGIELAG